LFLCKNGVIVVNKIISGGQTGVDQAALDAAISKGIGHGGWLPAGRKTEAGPLSTRYNLVEMLSQSYRERTRKNVMEADATLIISRGQLTGGSALTAAIAAELHKPCLHVDLKSQSRSDAVTIVKRWLRENDTDVLNVAGPRASSDEAIYRDAYNLVAEVLEV
jgi:hypothetical protein